MDRSVDIPLTPAVEPHSQRGSSALWTALCSRTFLTGSFLAFLVLLGLVLRIWFVSVNQLDPQYASTDDSDYFRRAFRFATTGHYVDDFWSIRPPLHVLFFALMLRISALTGVAEGLLLIRSVQVLLLVLTIPIGYDLARRLFNRRAGLIFAAILAVWFPLVELPAHLFSEPLFFFFLITHLWLLVAWRDRRRWYLLAGSGMALALAALARSQALYAATFVVLYLLLDALGARTRRDDPHAAPMLARSRSVLRRLWPAFARRSAIFLCACVLTITPWTIRNYLAYGHPILIDTTGPTILWLRVSQIDNGTDLLRSMPQSERYEFVRADLRRIIREDPGEFWRLVWINAWQNFHQIWKAQFIEDFFHQDYFYVRPLRAFWVPGLFGDLAWFIFTIGGLAALAAPAREGAFRVIALAWLAYMLAVVTAWHPEPRYLLPIWLILALYGAWALANPKVLWGLLARQRLHGLLALTLVASFLALCLSFRNYPQLITRGFQREWHLAAGTRAFVAGNFATAEAELRVALQAQPDFIESRAGLTMILIAQGKYQEAEALLHGEDDDAQQFDLARGVLAQARGHTASARALFADAENRSSEDIQAIARTWLHPPATRSLQLGTGFDLGYITGFSHSENLEHPGGGGFTYRWLEGQGQIVLTLPQPLTDASVIALRMAAGRPEGTRLRVDAGADEPQTLHVAGNQWRTYHLLLPDSLAGSEQLTLNLSAPTFIPAHRFPGSTDFRALSVMIAAVQVE